MHTVATKVPLITLNDDNQIPQLGFGVFQIDPNDTMEAVSKALEIGFRHIDTAEMYGNEHEVAAAIEASGIDRSDIFITSKLNNGAHQPDDARRAFDKTLQALDTDYIDLFLIHWPLPTKYNGDFITTWKVLEEFKKDGRAKSIGVSNFQMDHLKTLAAECEITPAVNQIELHPYFQNKVANDYNVSQGIATEAWSPIAQGKVLDDDVINIIADELGKTPAQIVLRWHIQNGNIIFPKSVTPDRMQENFAIFDFELTPAQVAAINKLNKGETGRNGPNPDTFDRT
jgi:2,5-diketo-D-gluconate reductase A